MKRIAFLLLASSVATPANSSRTSTVTVTTTYTSTSTIDGYTVTKTYICADLTSISGARPVGRNNIHLRDTLILGDELRHITEMLPQVPDPKIQHTGTLRGETTEIIQLPDYVNDQNTRQQQLNSKLSTTNVIESSMQSYFGWNKISLYGIKITSSRDFSRPNRLHLKFDTT